MDTDAIIHLSDTHYRGVAMRHHDASPLFVTNEILNFLGILKALKLV